jgi:hypothetical protein
MYSKKFMFLAMSMSSLVHKIIICIGQNSRTPLSTKVPKQTLNKVIFLGIQHHSSQDINNKIEKDWGIGKGSSCVTPLWLEK